ncbi:DUF4309 domain-containing protein [Paenibacillaceae bacterium]|nr:DUF4309 domain-containing protein [Paenibacillaceae bacterium]
MMIYQLLRKSARVVLLAVVTLGFTTISSPAVQVQAAAISTKAPLTAETQALQTLNSFYKPALQGQFPGAVKGLTIGVSTRQDVIKKIGESEAPGEDADAFDVYHAEMGHPGYAIAYKLNRIRELRYFGTNVERQTNIGGITLKMVKQQWGAPSASKTINNGKLVQNKVDYIRGNYVLSFIFNSSTDLDHINLTKKIVK